MLRISRRWMGGLCCLMVALALPAGLLPAQEPPPASAKPAPPADPTAVLKVIPADATAFLALRNLKEVDADILAITEKLGFPLAAIGFPNPLEFVKMNAGITGGLEENAGVAVAILNCANLPSSALLPTRLVLLIPCSNLDELTASMGAQKEGELIRLQNVAGLPMPSVAALKNGFLVVAPGPEAVQEVLRAQGGGVVTAMSPDRLDAYKTQDLAGWINLRGISKEVRQEVTALLMSQVVQANPMAIAPVQNALKQFDNFIDQAREASFGLTLDAKLGLKLSFYGRMQPESEMGQALAKVGTSDQSLLTGLPGEPTLVAAGFIGGAKNPSYERQLRQTLDQFISQDVLGPQASPEKINAIKESVVKFLVGLEQVAASVSALPRGTDDGMVGAAVVLKVANSTQAQAELRTLVNTFKDMLIKTAVERGELTEEDAKTASEAIQWKENAEQLGGASVDQFVFDLAKLPEFDSDQVEEVKSVIGQEGVLVRIAAVGANHIVVAFGGGAERFTRIAQHVQKGEAPLAARANYKMIADRVPSQGLMIEGYLGIDRVFTMVMDVGKQLGQPMMLPLAMKETAPIALTIRQVDKAAVEGELLIPIELAKAVMDMVQPLIQQFLMGGMGGGTGRPPGPGPMPPLPVP